jgi:predicted nucleic acid-binding protein
LILPDVNVLIYAFRSDTDRHADYKAWLENTVSGPGA